MKESVRHVVREIYCEVLFELAEEAGAVDAVMDDLASVESILRADPEFAAIMSSPTISGKEKAEVTRRVFSGKVTDLTLDFLSVLAKRNRMSNLFDISLNYESMLDTHYKRHPIEVVLAEEPDDKQIEELKAQLSKAIDGEVKLTVEIDPSIVGGIIIKKGGKVIDNSISTLLNRAVTTIVDKSRYNKNAPGEA